MNNNNQWRTILFSAAAFAALQADAIDVTVHNPAPFTRQGAVVEIPAEKIIAAFGERFEVKDAAGTPMVHQLTHDGLLLVEANLQPNSTVTLKVEKGTPLPADTICIGQIRHDLQDDYAWENDKSGYRLYGPSYRNGGGNVAGYDIWTKSVDFPVLAQRYDDHCKHGVSYHKDYGNGMDCYTVGRTLGAGMNALVVDGEIAYPCAYESCEIIDNGPLRTSAKVTCYPETIGNDKGVVEERFYTLDKGSWLNKTTVRYNGLSKSYPMVTGIVVHKQNKRGAVIDEGKRYVAYADLTDNKDNGNGVIYIGIVNETMPESISNEKMEPEAGDAVGQIMNHTTIAPGESYTYYWGSGWSKGGVKGVDDWTGKLARFHETLKYPLQVSVK